MAPAGLTDGSVRVNRYSIEQAWGVGATGGGAQLGAPDLSVTCGWTKASMIMALAEMRTLSATPQMPVHQQMVDIAQAKIRADLLAGRRSLFKPAPAGPRLS